MADYKFHARETNLAHVYLSRLLYSYAALDIFSHGSTRILHG